MNYFYYPGCSLTASAVEYDASTRACMAGLGAELTEIEDWTCCGATAVEAVSDLLTHALPARNLALAEKQGGPDQVLVPCSACYLNLLRVNREAMDDAHRRARVNEALSAEGLSYTGSLKVRHLLDALVNDVGPEAVAAKVERPLTAITVAPYYGCQILRPYPEFDDPELPTSMEGLIQACGAEIHEWGVGARCCGASLMATKQHAALTAVRAILEAAQGADAILTVCPLCQMNLEAYQSKALSGSRAKPMSVVYLPQFIGLALGLSEKEVGLHKNLAASGFRRSLKRPVPIENGVEDEAEAEVEA